MIYSLNENIKRLRIAQGLNQVEFGKIIGVTKQCVSNWENDNVLPSIDMLAKIAITFSVSTDYLLGLTETRTIDVDGLTDRQISYIQSLVNDLRAK